MPTLLLVDDNKTLAAFTALNLKTLMPELNVITAGSCRESRTLARKHHPDIFMLDRLLPDGDGYHLWTEMLVELPFARAIFLGTDADFLSKTLPPGVIYLLNKPFDIEELVPVIRQALLVRQKEPVDLSRDLPSQNERQAAPPDRINRHALVNHLTSIIAGLRAFSLDLQENIEDPQAIRGLLDEYIENLIDTARRAGMIVTGRAMKNDDGEE